MFIGSLNFDENDFRIDSDDEEDLVARIQPFLDSVQARVDTIVIGATRDPHIVQPLQDLLYLRVSNLQAVHIHFNDVSGFNFNHTLVETDWLDHLLETFPTIEHLILYAESRSLRKARFPIKSLERALKAGGSSVVVASEEADRWWSETPLDDVIVKFEPSMGPRRS